MGASHIDFSPARGTVANVQSFAQISTTENLELGGLDDLIGQKDGRISFLWDEIGTRRGGYTIRRGWKAASLTPVDDLGLKRRSRKSRAKPRVRPRPL